MGQKENLEFHAVQNFIVEYNRTHKHQITFCRQCQPPMPDTICKLCNKEIGVEVVHTYGSGIEAAMRLGNRESEHFSMENHIARRITSISTRALLSLNQSLSDKATKDYSFSPVWLLVRNALPLWSLRDYKMNRDGIEVPEAHPFTKIWLLNDHTSVGPHGIMCLA